MIARYQTPEMAALWSVEHRFRVWAEVERLALEAWERLGAVPVGVSAALARALPSGDFEPGFSARVAAIEAETHHDVVAFVRALAERSDDATLRRYLHYGLTSSDVVDTAQNRLLSEALDLVLSELQGLLRALRGRRARGRPRTPRSSAAGPRSCASASSARGRSHPVTPGDHRPRFSPNPVNTLYIKKYCACPHEGIAISVSGPWIRWT